MIMLYLPELYVILFNVDLIYHVVFTANCNVQSLLCFIHLISILYRLTALIALDY